VKHAVRRELLNALLIALGIFAAAMGLKGFLLSSHFIDGGVTGVSMLLAVITGAPLSVWLPLVNAPFIAIGYRQMGRAFAIRSALATAAWRRSSRRCASRMSLRIDCSPRSSAASSLVRASGWRFEAERCSTARRSPRC
jgi:uncharacterized membrane-anchored protein YitT (DUF2179 family)